MDGREGTGDKAGYHKRLISKAPYGTAAKVVEEIDEYLDAMEQGCKIMAMHELSDAYGALEALADKHSLTMDDLKTMSDITKRAFINGRRT
jgi:phosphoribosyl-ATP pyrophosphohydrolase